MLGPVHLVWSSTIRLGGTPTRNTMPLQAPGTALSNRPRTNRPRPSRRSEATMIQLGGTQTRNTMMMTTTTMTPTTVFTTTTSTTSTLFFSTTTTQSGVSYIPFSSGVSKSPSEALSTLIGRGVAGKSLSVAISIPLAGVPWESRSLWCDWTRGTPLPSWVESRSEAMEISAHVRGRTHVGNGVGV